MIGINRKGMKDHKINRLPFDKVVGAMGLTLFLLFTGLGPCKSYGARADISAHGDKGTNIGAGEYLKDNSKNCHPEFLVLLRQKKLDLEKKNESLAKEEQDLDFLRQEMDNKVKMLKDLQRSLEGPVKRRKFQEQARLQHLAGVYGSMEPSRAAALLDKMDEDTVTKLFSIMKSKKVAPILSKMSPDKAARISAYLYKKPPPEY